MRDYWTRVIPPPIRRRRPGRNARRADNLTQAQVLIQRAEFWAALTEAYMAHVASKPHPDDFDLLALNAFGVQLDQLAKLVHDCNRPRLVTDNTGSPADDHTG